MTNETILEYKKYIYSISKKFENYKNKEDLIQVGFLGLVMALRNYRKDLNVKFTTYAYKYIYGEMCKLVREDKNIKVSPKMIKLKNSVEKAKVVLSQSLLREPTNLELANFLELPVDTIEEVLKINTSVYSIDKTINTEEKEMNLYDVIPDKKLDVDSLIMLKSILLNMDLRSRKLLSDSLKMTEREIGNKYNMSQVKVSRTLKKIKQNIRQKMQ